MEGNNYVSKVTAEVGEFYQDQSCPKINISIIINSDIAQQAKQQLEVSTGGNVDTEFAIVLGFPCELGHEEAVKSALDTVLSDINYKGNLFKGPRRDIS